MRLSHLLLTIVGAMALAVIFSGPGLSKAASGNPRLKNLGMNSGCSPAIEFTDIPAYGSFDNLKGRVTGVNPAEYKVAVYIRVGSGYRIL